MLMDGWLPVYSRDRECWVLTLLLGANAGEETLISRSSYLTFR